MITPEKRLIAVNNGIYNKDNDKLYPFSPAYCFLAKTAASFDRAKTGVVERRKLRFDLDEWFSKIVPPDEVSLLWRTIASVGTMNLVPHQCVFLYGGENSARKDFMYLLDNIAGFFYTDVMSLSDFTKARLVSLINPAGFIIGDNGSRPRVSSFPNDFCKTVYSNVMIKKGSSGREYTYCHTGFVVEGFDRKIHLDSDMFYHFQDRQISIHFYENGKPDWFVHDCMGNSDIADYALTKALREYDPFGNGAVYE